MNNPNVETMIVNQCTNELRRKLIEKYRVDTTQINLSKNKERKHSVTAISGMSAAGKTSLSQEILNEYSEMVFFDFGELYRSITYYLTKQKNMTKEQVRDYFDKADISNIFDIDFEIQDRICKIKIDNKVYKEKDLHNQEMDQLTVDIGVILGDKMNPKVREIIDKIRESSPVLLNARRPVAAYQDIENHIFLKADFEERVKRRALQDGIVYEEAKQKAIKRDEKEKSGGFWEIFEFTKIIDTTDVSIEQVKQEIIEFINSKKNNEVETKKESHKLENLTLILNSYACDKGCPFCIAKNNKKFIGKEESFENLKSVFEKLKQANIEFDRIVISGNGEPSLYSEEHLKQIVEAISMYNELFSQVRVHTSGNIFYEKEKLDLFKEAFGDKLEIDFFRVSLNSEEDMKILDYSRDYINSELFKSIDRIKMDIGLTNSLDDSHFVEELDEFLKDNPNIRTVRFKKLMSGEHELSSQAQWVNKETLPRQSIIKIACDLEGLYGSNTHTEFETSEGVTIKFEKTGNYSKDIVLSNGKLQGYDEKELNVEELVGISQKEDDDKYLEI